MDTKAKASSTAWSPLFADSPEYTKRKEQVFSPPVLRIKDVHAAVPKHLLEKSTSKSIYYVVQHLAVTAALFVFAYNIDNIVTAVDALAGGLPGKTKPLLEWGLWIFYWFWQSILITGFWTLGHECGHDALFNVWWANASLGLFLHSAILTPYYSWRATHRSHHKGTNHLARDETFHPFTREDLKLPPEERARAIDYKDMIEETPLYTIFKMCIRQFWGFQLYLLHNRKGNPKYPKFTSHYDPNAKLFRPSERWSIVISDIGVLSMFALLVYWTRVRGWSEVRVIYFIPWLVAHNWIVTFTYLQHSDPTVPYYREKEWTFLRGALATVDRPLFGWVGRVFWHGIAHDHIAHHFFVNVPFYNLPEVTEAIKPVLGDYYYYDPTPTFRALWRSFTQCTFIESKGDVVFFKNQQGKVAREYVPRTESARESSVSDGEGSSAEVSQESTQ